MSTELWFSHSQVRSGKPLVISTRPDQINWGYELHVAKWATYAGEVVQILSVAIGDLTVQGTISTLAEQANIYSYFIEYMQIATQGRSVGSQGQSVKSDTGGQAAGVTSYNQESMLFHYPHRNWTFNIMPRSLPGYRRGTEVIAPAWQLQAFIVDDQSDSGQELINLVKDQVTLDGAVDTDFALVGQIVTDRPAGGFNPFSAPFSPAGKQVEFDPTKTQAAVSQYGDQFSKVIPAWMQGDLSSLSVQASMPGFLQFGQGTKGLNPNTTTVANDATGGSSGGNLSAGSP